MYIINEKIEEAVLKLVSHTGLEEKMVKEAYGKRFVIHATDDTTFRFNEEKDKIIIITSNAEFKNAIGDYTDPSDIPHGSVKYIKNGGFANPVYIGFDIGDQQKTDNDYNKPMVF